MVVGGSQTGVAGLCVERRCRRDAVGVLAGGLLRRLTGDGELERDGRHGAHHDQQQPEADKAPADARLERQREAEEIDRDGEHGEDHGQQPHPCLPVAAQLVAGVLEREEAVGLVLLLRELEVGEAEVLRGGCVAVRFDVGEAAGEVGELRPARLLELEKRGLRGTLLHGGKKELLERVATARALHLAVGEGLDLGASGVVRADQLSLALHAELLGDDAGVIGVLVRDAVEELDGGHAERRDDDEDSEHPREPLAHLVLLGHLHALGRPHHGPALSTRIHRTMPATVVAPPAAANSRRICGLVNCARVRNSSAAMKSVTRPTRLTASPCLSSAMASVASGRSCWRSALLVSRRRSAAPASYVAGPLAWPGSGTAPWKKPCSVRARTRSLCACACSSPALVGSVAARVLAWSSRTCAALRCSWYGAR